MNSQTTESNEGAPQLIDKMIADLPDWRGKAIARLREIIHETEPEIVEEWKWGTAVWSRKGNVLAAASFKDYIKINFFKGASLVDPQGLFNAGLEAKASRAMDIRDWGSVPEDALKDLIRAAAALNLTGKKK